MHRYLRIGRYLGSIGLVAIGCGLAFLAVLPGHSAPPVSLPQSRPGASVLPQRVGDQLILRSGTIERGEIKSYVGDRCQLGAKNIPRDQIAWLGFSTALARPPAIIDPSHDEVHLRNGGVQSSRLVAVNLTQVVTEKRAYNRSEIAWIALALKETGTIKGEEAPSTPVPSPTSSPVPTVTPSATRSPRPVRDAVKPCPADKPLGGHIEVKYVEDELHGSCQGTIRTVLRFPLVDNASSTSPWSSRLWVGFSATELNYDVSSAGCVDVPGDDEICQAAGGRKTGKVILGTIGKWGFVSAPHVGSLTFNPVKPELYFDALPDEIHEAFTKPLTCVKNGGGGTQSSWTVGFAGGQIRPRRPGETEHAFVPLVDWPKCDDRDCMQHAERYAVIPFTGHSVWTDPRPQSDFPRVETTWEVCCGCGAPPTPPEPGDGCPSTLEADSRLETNREQRKEKLAELKKAGAAYEEKYKESKKHYDDYVKTIQACVVQSVATRIMIALLVPEEEGVEVSHEVEQAVEWAEGNGLYPPMGMQLIAKIVEKIVNGEDPAAALGPENLQNWNEDMAILAKVETLLSGRNAEQMEKSLEECQGAFLVSPETKLSADKCVENFKEALEDLAEFNKLRNDIRNLDTAYPDLQYKAWAACVERARCKGTPESACADKKPVGNWPDVPR